MLRPVRWKGVLASEIRIARLFLLTKTSVLPLSKVLMELGWER